MWLTRTRSTGELEVMINNGSKSRKRVLFGGFGCVEDA